MPRPTQPLYPPQPGTRLGPVEGVKIWRVQLTATLQPGESATAKRVDYMAEDSYDSSESEITIYDPLYRAFGLEDERLLVYYNNDSQRWEVLGEFGLRRLGKTNAAHDKGNSGVVNIYTGDGNSETNTGETVTAYNRFADVETGKWVWVEYRPNADGEGVWYLTAAEC